MLYRRLFVNRGKKIQLFHRNLLMKYELLIAFPFFALLALFHYDYTFPVVRDFSEKQNITPLIIATIVTIIVVLFALTISSYITERSILKGGFFFEKKKLELLANYLMDNDYIVRKKVADGKETQKLPPVYYKNKKDVDEFTFRIGNKFHDKFLNIGKPLEELYMADLVEIERTPQHVTYKLLVDNISKRLKFQDVEAKDGTIKLMKGIEWDFDELPHMLVTGGTGGGKTYFLYTLIAHLGKLGRIHIADPKKSDLANLADFPAFKGLAVADKKDIFAMLKEAVGLMDKRYKYMKEHDDYKMGKNYRYYGMYPEFFIVDEWAAFVSTLSVTEEMELYQMISPLVLKARQAGVFLIVATQKAGTDVIKSAIRDNLMCKLSLGSLSATGYEITFGQENKNKLFYNKVKIKGRGYIDVGKGIPQEFYAPLIEIDRGFSFEKFFAEMKPMPFTDVSHIELSKEENIKPIENDFPVRFQREKDEDTGKKKVERQNKWRAMEQEHQESLKKKGG